MQIFNNPNFDFVRWRWHAIALSLVVILAGVVVIWTRGLPLGVEFAGGTHRHRQVRAAAGSAAHPHGAREQHAGRRRRGGAALRPGREPAT